MTKEEFKKAVDINEKIAEAERKIPILSTRVERFDDYIGFMDGRVPPLEAHGKILPKVEVKFNINDRMTDVDARDMFNIVEENKKEFIDFLKKCQANYKKKLEAQGKEIKELEKEFENIGKEEKTEAA